MVNWLVFTGALGKCKSAWTNGKSIKHPSLLIDRNTNNTRVKIHTSKLPIIQNTIRIKRTECTSYIPTCEHTYKHNPMDAVIDERMETAVI